MQVSEYRKVLSLWLKTGGMMSFEFEYRPQSDQQFEEEKNNVNDIMKKLLKQLAIYHCRIAASR